MHQHGEGILAISQDKENYLEIKKQTAKFDLISSRRNLLLQALIRLYLVCISARGFDKPQRAINSTKSLTDRRLHH